MQRPYSQPKLMSPFGSIKNQLKLIGQFITDHKHKKLSDYESTDTNPEQKIVRLPQQKLKNIPYEIDNQLKISAIGYTTYKQMLKNLSAQLLSRIQTQQKVLNQLRYQKNFSFSKISQLRQHVQKIRLFLTENQYIIQNMQKYYKNIYQNDIIHLFMCDLMPANIQWQIWKHQSEILKFVVDIQPEIVQMSKYHKFKQTSGDQIICVYNIVRNIKRVTKQNQLSLHLFFQLLSSNRYLKKTQTVLTWISHCLPINLWHIKVYKQIPIYQNPMCMAMFGDKKPKLIQYLTITSNGIKINTKSPIQSKIDQIIPFTNQFTFHSEVKSFNQLHYTVSSCSRQNIQIKFKNDIFACINFHIGLLRAYIDTGNTDINRFSSYSQPRKNCWSKLYADGDGYFEDMCIQLLKARKQVCITDWWMTPYFLLKRNPKNGINIRDNTNRLDGILQKIANRGVSIFIILFRQPHHLLCNDSYHCQTYLQSLSRNIRVYRHPIAPQKWSHHQKCVIIDQKIGFMGGLDICYGRWDTRDHHITNINNYWDGGDYVNQRLRAYTPGTTKFYTDPPVDRLKQARMPWHDIGIQLRGDAVLDLARHFIQYWYFVDTEKLKDPHNHFRNLQLRWDRAKSYHYSNQVDDQEQEEQLTQHQKIKLLQKKALILVTGDHKRAVQLSIEVNAGKNKGDQQLQMCRSASPWSIGARDFEQSIHNAYQALIRESKHFIYIQNQFFMGRQNKIVECLAQRIRRAHINNQNFKIVVVMPLMPGFQGSIAQKKNVPLRVQVQNQFQSINRGTNSLHARLSDLTNFCIDDYIYFFGLRNHGILNGNPITQIIYVHSKLMIVDDKRAIIGSANINDRSLCGNRDSQLAIVIEQNNGNIHDNNIGKKQINQFRYQIFNQHFGLTRQQSNNINSPQIWTKMLNNAKNNTLIYRKLFGCYPDDTVTVSQQVQILNKQSQPFLYYQLAPSIFAHAVQFPLHFMEDQKLQFQFGDKQILLGVQTFL